MNPALVCIPTYNERDNVEAISAAVLAADPRVDVLVVDDNSPDGTGQLADALAAREPRLRVLHRERKQGLGRAYLNAFRWAMDAGYSYVIEMDADFSHDPRFLPRLLDEAEGGVDLVLGSRYVPGGGTLNWGALRRFISKGGSFYARTILGVPVRDLTGGFKCFRRRVLETIDLEAVRSSGYAFQIELTYRALQKGFQVKEIPIVFEDRRVGQSKMSRKIFLEGLTMVWKLRLTVRGKPAVTELLAQFGVSISAIFFVVDPIGVVPVFLAMTHRDSPEKSRSMCRRACLTACGLLVFFALFGSVVFNALGVSLSAFRVAGGILLLITSLDMLRARTSETKTSPVETEEGAEKDDIAIVPLAVPLLAGPGAIATVVMLMSRGKGVLSAVPVLASIVLTFIASYYVLRAAGLVQRALGQSGVAILQRVMGLILAAIAVQFVADGGRELLGVR